MSRGIREIAAAAASSIKHRLAQFNDLGTNKANDPLKSHYRKTARLNGYAVETAKQEARATRVRRHHLGINNTESTPIQIALQNGKPTLLCGQDVINDPSRYLCPGETNQTTGQFPVYKCHTSNFEGQVPLTANTLDEQESYLGDGCDLTPERYRVTTNSSLWKEVSANPALADGVTGICFRSDFDCHGAIAPAQTDCWDTNNIMTLGLGTAALSSALGIVTYKVSEKIIDGWRARTRQLRVLTQEGPINAEISSDGAVDVAEEQRQKSLEDSVRFENGSVYPIANGVTKNIAEYGAERQISHPAGIEVPTAALIPKTPETKRVSFQPRFNEKDKLLPRKSF